MKNKLKPSMQFPAGSERRDYVLADKTALLEMNEMVWYPPYAIDTRHYHNCMEIGVCMAGDGTLTLGSGMSRSFSQGTVVIVPSGLLHSQQNRGENGTRWRYVIVDEQRFMEEIPARGRADVSRLLSSIRASGLYLDAGDVHDEVLRLLYMMFDAHNRYAGEAMGEIEALLLLLLVRASREPIRREMNAVLDPLHMKSIEPSILYVSEHYGQEIRVQEMARACAMSESYFRKTFNQLMGLSPLEYVNRYRVHRAMHLLQVTDDSVQRIALECGFPSTVTFTRNFFRYAGQNPSSWRREHAHR